MADPAATLAFYMGRNAASHISRQLMAHGLDAATPVLIASNVSLADECMIYTRLDLLALAIDQGPDAGPAVIIVGEPARRRQADARVAAFAALA